LKKAIIIVAGAIVFIAGLYLVFKEELDRFNPLYEKEYVYVQVNEPSEPENGRYKYQLTGYNEEGQEKKVTFTSSTDLEQGIYLRVLAKGGYTESWEFISEEELPSDTEW